MFKAHHIPPLAVLVLAAGLGVAHITFAQVQVGPAGVPTTPSVPSATTTTTVVAPSPSPSPSAATGSSDDTEKKDREREGDRSSSGRGDALKTFFGAIQASTKSTSRYSSESGDRPGLNAIGQIFQTLQNIRPIEANIPQAVETKSGNDEAKKQIPQLIVSLIASSSAVVPNAAVQRVMQGVPDQNVQDNSSDVAKLIENIRTGAQGSTTVKEIQSVISKTPVPDTPSPTTIKEILKQVIETAPLPPRKSEDERRSATSGPSAILVSPSPAQPGTSGDMSQENSDRTSSSSVVAPPVPVVEPADQVSQLEQIGQAIHTIRTERTNVDQKINSFVAQNVEKTVKEATSRVPITPAPVPGKVFDPTEREKIIANITDVATERGNQIAAQLTQTINNPSIEPKSVDPVLKSSLQDIAALVQSESGTPVDIAPGSRKIAQEIGDATQHIQETQKVLEQRDGLAMYRDSDKDGISDYDEVNIYHTDPYNAYTAGGKLTDGERVLLGLDPHTTSGDPVPVQSPKDAGVETKSVFEVSSITLVSQPAAAAVASTPVVAANSGTTTSPAVANTVATSSVAPTTVAAAPQGAPTPVAPAAPKDIRFSGRALPNSFVTLYIYSTPIAVTVKTDENGLWTYTLDKQLEDGSHTLYVATVDDAGKILAKSAPIPFTKTAEALDYQPLVIQAITDISPLEVIQQHLFVASGVLVLLFTMVALLAVGFRREQSLA